MKTGKKNFKFTSRVALSQKFSAFECNDFLKVLIVSRRQIGFQLILFSFDPLQDLATLLNKEFLTFLSR